VIPSVLAGLLTVYVVYRLGRELWGPTAGRYAAAVAATTQGLFIHARVPMPDMLLTAFAALALWALYRMRRRSARWAWLGFYAALAGGFWAKGPAGLLPLGIALGVALARRRTEPPGWLRLVPGMLLLGGLLAPWVLAASLRQTHAMHETVAVDYLLWYLPQRLSILTVVSPLEHLISVMLPWAWLLPFALHDAWRTRRGRGAERETIVLLLVWIVGVFGALCLSQQQRVRYYVPLVPALSLLLGWWIAATVTRHRRVSLWPLRATAALVATGLAFAGVWSVAQGRLPRDLGATLPSSSGATALIVAAALTLVVAMHVGLRHGLTGRAFPVAVIAAAALVVMLDRAEQTGRNATHDYPAVARAADRARAAGEPVVTLGVPTLPLAFYLRERVTELGPDPVGGPAALPPGVMLVADAAALAGHDDAIEVVDRVRLGRQDVVIGHARPPLLTLASAPPRSPRAAGSGRLPHIAFELLCLTVALGGVVARTLALRHGAAATGVYAAEASVIVALASFPAHLGVFATGAAAACAWAYCRWRRPPLPDRPQLWAAGLLMLALPLDVFDDVLQHRPIAFDPVWLVSAALGVALLTWSRARPVRA
jgi:4-amino-4-deoxy-L-arabinose transferase-like glycosyltransferase